VLPAEPCSQRALVDFHKYHNGADWLTQLENGAIMDPKINALSIFAKVLGDPEFVDATVNVPSNWTAPISGLFNYHVTSAFPEVNAPIYFCYVCYRVIP